MDGGYFYHPTILWNQSLNQYLPWCAVLVRVARTLAFVPSCVTNYDFRCEVISEEKINMYQPIFFEYHQVSSEGVWSSDNTQIKWSLSQDIALDWTNIIRNTECRWLLLKSFSNIITVCAIRLSYIFLSWFVLSNINQACWLMTIKFDRMTMTTYR